MVVQSKSVGKTSLLMVGSTSRAYVSKYGIFRIAGPKIINDFYSCYQKIRNLNSVPQLYWKVDNFYFKISTVCHPQTVLGFIFRQTGCSSVCSDQFSHFDVSQKFLPKNWIAFWKISYFSRISNLILTHWKKTYVIPANYLKFQFLTNGLFQRVFRPIF